MVMLTVTERRGRRVSDCVDVEEVKESEEETIRWKGIMMRTLV